jgi:hypothetical protein
MPGYLDGGFQRNAAAIVKTQNSTKPVHMNVNGNKQFRFIDIAPKPGVNVVSSDHPAEKEVEAFGCAAPVWACQKKRKTF